MSTHTETPPTAPLRRLRQQRGLAQRKLADLADCSISTVWLAERGGFLSERMAARFAKALGCTPRDILPPSPERAP